MALKDNLVSLLYGLLRDQILPGDLEKEVREVEKFSGHVIRFSNRGLEMYAREIVDRLCISKDTPVDDDPTEPLPNS